MLWSDLIILLIPNVEVYEFIIGTSDDECTVGEIKVKKSQCFVTCVYRSPYQTADEINVFLSDFEQDCSKIDLESPILIIIHCSR